MAEGGREQSGPDLGLGGIIQEFDDLLGELDDGEFDQMLDDLRDYTKEFGQILANLEDSGVGALNETPDVLAPGPYNTRSSTPIEEEFPDLFDGPLEHETVEDSGINLDGTKGTDNSLNDVTGEDFQQHPAPKTNEGWQNAISVAVAMLKRRTNALKHYKTIAEAARLSYNERKVSAQSSRRRVKKAQKTLQEARKRVNMFMLNQTIASRQLHILKYAAKNHPTGKPSSKPFFDGLLYERFMALEELDAQYDIDLKRALLIPVPGSDENSSSDGNIRSSDEFSDLTASVEHPWCMDMRGSRPIPKTSTGSESISPASSGSRRITPVSGSRRKAPVPLASARNAQVPLGSRRQTSGCSNCGHIQFSSGSGPNTSASSGSMPKPPASSGSRPVTPSISGSDKSSFVSSGDGRITGYEFTSESSVSQYLYTVLETADGMPFPKPRTLKGILPDYGSSVDPLSSSEIPTDGRSSAGSFFSAEVHLDLCSAVDPLPVQGVLPDGKSPQTSSATGKYSDRKVKTCVLKNFCCFKPRNQNGSDEDDVSYQKTGTLESRISGFETSV